MGVDVLPLQGRRIGVTRPRRQAGNLCRMIEERGGRAHRFPMIEIAAVEPLPGGDWWRGQDWLIFVSANAVRFALAAGLRAPGARLAAIGRATAAALEKNGFQVACRAPAPYTSESLLDQDCFRQVNGRRILIVRGVGGRPKLAETLAGRGAEVSLAELYRRLPPSRAAVETLRACLCRGLDAVLVTSAEVLANLQRAAGEGVEALRALPLVVGGERLAGKAWAARFEDVTAAASALDADMLAALEKRLVQERKA